MKKIIVLDQGTGRLANQLWNSVAIYAYCLEKKYAFRNVAFTDYEHLFDFPKEGFWFRLFFLKGMRKNKVLVKLRLYKYYLKIMRALFSKYMIYSTDRKPFYLPPTENTDLQEKQILKKIEEKSAQSFFFNNWLFRNPVGIQKYHSEIRTYFRPRKEILEVAEGVIAKARAQAPKVIGIHIRQGDYRAIDNGVFYFSPEQVKPILEQYLQTSGKRKEDVIFLISSDEKIDEKIFSDFNTLFLSGSALEDMMTLSMTDGIIGTNSTYGAFAAYYGNIPIIIFEKGTIDWSPFGRKNFNYDNMCTQVHQ